MERGSLDIKSQHIQGGQVSYKEFVPNKAMTTSREANPTRE